MDLLPLLYHIAQNLYSAENRKFEVQRVDLSETDMSALVDWYFSSTFFKTQEHKCYETHTLSTWNFGTGALQIRIGEGLCAGEYRIHYKFTPPPAVAPFTLNDANSAQPEGA